MIQTLTDKRQTTQKRIVYPPKASKLFTDWNKYFYIVLYGGRGSAKSETVARYIIGRCQEKKIKVLCIRESQNSIGESVHSLLSGIIANYGLHNHFEVQRDKIICKKTGSTIIFKGLRQEAGHIRSMHDVDIVWVEEGQYIKRPGWTSLDDTIRKEGSIIIICMNPRHPDDPLYNDFVAVERPDTLRININIPDNPFATEVQKAKAKRMLETNPEMYAHVYLGGFENFGATIGAFPKIPKFTADYLCAYIDTSWSDSSESDRTSCSIVGFSIKGNEDLKECPIEFTGMSWQKSISNPDVMNELLLFLNKYKPIETRLESQLSDSTVIFINQLKNYESALNLPVKNFWTYEPGRGNKHERIMQRVAMNKTRMAVLEETDPRYLNPVVYYSKKIDHDDEIDSLAGAINLWLTSENLRNYIMQYEQLKRQKAI